MLQNQFVGLLINLPDSYKQIYPHRWEQVEMFSLKLKNFNLLNQCARQKEEARKQANKLRMKSAALRETNLVVAQKAVSKAKNVLNMSSKRRKLQVVVTEDSSEEEPPSLPVDWRQQWNVKELNVSNSVSYLPDHHNSSVARELTHESDRNDKKSD